MVLQERSAAATTPRAMALMTMKILLTLASICCMYYGKWKLLIIMSPLWFADLIASQFQQDLIGSIVVLFLCAQAITVWLLSTHHLFSDISSTTKSHLWTNSRLYGVYSPGGVLSQSSLSFPWGKVENGGVGSNAIAAATDHSARDLRSTYLKEIDKAESIFPPDNMFPVAVLRPETAGHINSASRAVLASILNNKQIAPAPLVPVEDVEATRQTTHQKIYELPIVDFPDLKYRSMEEIHSKHPKLFEELPRLVHGRDAPDSATTATTPTAPVWLESTKNPCWYPVDRPGDAGKGGGTGVSGRPIGESKEPNTEPQELRCLPYAYVLGQPKSGTTDLFERLKAHHLIAMPSRKEVRWFTRGEFSTTALVHEGNNTEAALMGDAEESQERRWQGRDSGSSGSVGRGRRRGSPKQQLLGPGSTLLSFARSFREPSRRIQQALLAPGSTSKGAGTGAGTRVPIITIDGGPHTLWWPTQSPDGAFLPEDVPYAQLLRAMQPDARLILTLSDPVRRLYSDYYFLDDSLKPLRRGGERAKSAIQFHARALVQVQAFNSCVRAYEDVLHPQLHQQSEGSDLELPIWFRAAQMCAHDRYRFAVGGWGRLAIGLYVLHLEKWLEQFDPAQFLLLRLEDFSQDPERYMQRVFDFLGVGAPDNWGTVLQGKRSNTHWMQRDPILEETETLLRDFYRPYNQLLARLVEQQQLLLLSRRTSADPVDEGVFEGARQEARSLAAGFTWELASAAGAGGGESSPHALGSTLRAEHLKEQQQRAEHLKQQQQSAPGTGGGVGRGNTAHDQHSLHRHFDESSHDPRGSGDIELHTSAGVAEGRAERGAERSHPRPRFRGTAGVGAGEQGSEYRQLLRPHRFSPEQLGLESELSYWAARNQTEREIYFGATGARERRRLADEADSIEEVAEHLCSAAFTLDVAAVRHILLELGVPGDARNQHDCGRSGLHCLALLSAMGDAHSRSHVFSALKGTPSWLTPLFEPPLPLHQASVLSRDIVHRLQPAMMLVGRWLLAGGADPSGQDCGLWTPLHLTSMGGEAGLARLLLDAGADPNRTNRAGRTALHFAAVTGDAEVAGLLVEAGADLHLPDALGVRPIDIISNPGPVLPADALRFLNITQRPARQIRRIIHPELHPELNGSDTVSEAAGPGVGVGWAAGDGGWDWRRLAGYEHAQECGAVDQYWAHEITAQEVLEKYVLHNAPVLIRGLLQDWGVVQRYRRDRLVAERGDLGVQVSDIPYAVKFGGSGQVDMSLGQYVQQMQQHKVLGGAHPWYVFKGHPIPRASEDAHTSLVPVEDCPTPAVLQEAFNGAAKTAPAGGGSPSGAAAESGAGDGARSQRKVFVNAQWALGSEGTGAPVHFHNTAWNALIYGAKKWVVYPPARMIMSNKQILEYVETDMEAFAQRGVQPVTCVQLAGDVMIIPESWGHGVLNLQESVAVATEVKSAQFRMRPGTHLFGQFSAAPPRDSRGRRADRQKQSRRRRDSLFGKRHKPRGGGREGRE